jgi:hypothetical protein
MSGKIRHTRRQALMLSGATAIGLALGALPRVARTAAPVAPSLPIPTLIEARNTERP